MNTQLFSQEKIAERLFLIKFLNFHESLEVALKEVWACIEPNVAKALFAEVPDDVVILIPTQRGLHHSEWFCVSNETAVSHRVYTVEKGSLATVITSDKRAAILLQHSYDEAAERSK